MLRNLKSFNAPELEEKVLALWKEKRIFEKSITPQKGKKTKQFNFWEGPPTANGRPGIHHVLARVFKDVFVRYKTMQGYIVPRKAGWDTHGLPVELQVEKQLALTSKKDIEHYGIEKFNQQCKESVWIHKSEFEKLTERIGFWLDMKHPYVTYHNTYMETLWWIIKQMFDRKLLYEGHKIVNWCPRCGTALSSHELAQGYKTVKDNSVFVKFKLKPHQKFGSYKTGDSDYILSWTTTPWTLPGNVALAVGEKIVYSAVRLPQTHDLFILAHDTIQQVFKDQGVEIIHNDIQGKDLIGLSYEPLFDIVSLQHEMAHKVYEADFVTTTDGTGVVHTAVMYGEDDYQLGKKLGLPQYHTVDESGRFTKEVKELSGKFVKDEQTEIEIFKLLHARGALLRKEKYEHEYPHCWRCDTPLLYYARTSWFVKMSQLKQALLKANKQVDWIPAHIRDGRFGEWLKEVKDWNFSRERYWGTPLPIWRCDACNHIQVIGSKEELIKTQPKHHTRYILVRHGEAQHNIKKIINGDVKKSEAYKLTVKGEKDIRHCAKKLQKQTIDIILTSDIHRAQHTAHILGDALNVRVVVEKRLREINLGELEGMPIERYNTLYPTYEDRFSKRPDKGESVTDLAQRVYACIEDIEKKYAGKTVAIVSHEYPLWMFSTVLQGLSQEEAIEIKEKRGKDFIETGSCDRAQYVSFPRNQCGFGDMHRPYIDGVIFQCTECAEGTMTRVPEVADVWFDSGAMPFAQERYPFAHTKQKSKNKKPEQYPADYICEAVDQTRGWFYTLLAVATTLGLPVPYKHVVCLGLVHDKYGQKMSKSRGNIVDPWMMIEKYGVDAVRWYFYTVNAPGEPKNFDESEVGKALRGTSMVLYNSFAFLHMYGTGKQNIEKTPHSKQILDRWICARVAQSARTIQNAMDIYDITRATEAFTILLDDVSRWYIRRSRRRLQKPENNIDAQAASQTLAYVLLQCAKISAPFIPFFAEALYQSLKKEYTFIQKDSVHLETYPKLKTSASDMLIIELMEWVRDIASKALAKRAALGIKVRQPLAQLTIQGKRPKGVYVDAVCAILADEVNVKKIIFNETQEEAFVLDETITPELRAEGLVRECTRTIQELRQTAGYVPRDVITVYIASTTELEAFMRTYEKELCEEVGAKTVVLQKVDGLDAEIDGKLDGKRMWIGIKKIG